MADLSSVLPKLPYWQQLSPAQRELVTQYAQLRSFSKGEVLSGCGESCLGMVFILEGRLRAYLLSPEGREITLYSLEEGDPCVMSASCVMSQITFETHLVVEQDCRMLVVGIPAFGHLAEENIYVKCFMYELATQRFSSVMWAMQQLLFARFDQRLAAFLLQECQRTGKNEVTMTHEQIAQQVSSAREVVARMLKRFNQDEIVIIKRGKILVKNLERLQEIVSE